MYHFGNIPPIEPQGRLAAFARLLNDFDPDELGLAIDLAIARLDARDGDPDLEPNGDERDASYPESMVARSAVISGRATGHEDAEDDDEPEDDDEDCCDAGDDEIRSGLAPRWRMLERMQPAGWKRVGDEDDAEPDDLAAFVVIHAPANDL